MQLRLRDLMVRVSRNTCGSLDIEVESSGLLISDTRRRGDNQQAGSIISIAQGPKADSNLTDQHGRGLMRGAWTQLRTAVAGASAPFITLRRLAHHSSFEQHRMLIKEDSRAKTLLSHRTTEDEIGEAPLFGGLLTHAAPEAAEAELPGDYANDVAATGKTGFKFEYVIQLVAPCQGPHVMEVQLLGAELHWPYILEMDFIFALAETYSHFFRVAWASPYAIVSSHDCHVCLF